MCQERGAPGTRARVYWRLSRGVAQPGSAPAWGAGGSLVRIQSPRPNSGSSQPAVLCGCMTAVAVCTQHATLLDLNEDLCRATGRDQPADVAVLVPYVVKL